MLFLAVAISASAENNSERNLTFSAGVHVGTDVGGAVPIPLSNAIGSNDQVNASLRLRPNIGLSSTAAFNERWALTLEATYKTIGLSADARVENQTFLDRGNDPWIWVSFRGNASMEMSFSMLEIPLYVRYAIGSSGKNRLLFGVYYARVFNANFLTTSQKGMLFNVIDGVTDFNNPIGIISPDGAVAHDFSDVMNRWDTGIMLGYERQIFCPRLTISGRFSMGFNDIFQPGKRYLAYRMQHIRGTIAISYTFWNGN